MLTDHIALPFINSTFLVSGYHLKFSTHTAMCTSGFIWYKEILTSRSRTASRPSCRPPYGNPVLQKREGKFNTELLLSQKFKHNRQISGANVLYK